MGVDNPADLPSRSVNATNLVNNTLWWNGPAFLLNSPENWPDLPTKFECIEADKKLMKNPPTIIHSLAITSRESRTTVNLEQIMEIKNLDQELNG